MIFQWSEEFEEVPVTGNWHMSQFQRGKRVDPDKSRPVSSTSVTNKITEQIILGDIEKQCSHWSQPEQVHGGTVLFNKLNFFL